jgi:alkylation response protein AidB-like acyl-CoA dehydrogenase
MAALLDRLLASPPTVHDATPEGSLAAWWKRHAAACAGLEPIEAAVLGGLHADRVGFAFAAGYQAALRRLLPSLDGAGVAALAATEAGGGHPSAIATSLAAEGDEGDSRVLRGKKSWITMADAADTLLVVASTHRTEGRNHLVVARVDAKAPGVTLSRMPPTPFVPEVAHAELALDGVRIADADVLPGDGYEAYLKPFRTIEDLHVHGAVLGYFVGVGRRSGWPAAAIESLAALIAATCALARDDARSPAVHVATAGLLAAARRAIDELEPEWANVAEAERARWPRDRALLSVAQKARALRTESAWRALGGAPRA